MEFDYLPKHLRPDRSKYPGLTDREWECAIAVLEEGCVRHHPLLRLELVVSDMLPESRPWLLDDGAGNLTNLLEELPKSKRVFITRAVFKVVSDAAREDERWGGTIP